MRLPVAVLALAASAAGAHGPPPPIADADRADITRRLRIAALGPSANADLPVDADGLIARNAPRPLLISHGIHAAGDAAWADQHGSSMATVDASDMARSLRRVGQHLPAPSTKAP